jgi:hypothetical protein
MIVALGSEGVRSRDAAGERATADDDDNSSIN